MTHKRHPAFQALLDERLRTMAEFSPNHRPLNIYALYNAALDMPTGKLVPQCGHAYDMAHDLAKLERPEITAQYKGTGNGTKICMYAKNEAQLERAYDDAIAAGIPVVIIADRSHILLPHFDGKPVITALGIGPAYRDEVEHFMKRYTMAR